MLRGKLVENCTVHKMSWAQNHEHSARVGSDALGKDLLIYMWDLLEPMKGHEIAWLLERGENTQRAEIRTPLRKEERTISQLIWSYNMRVVA